MNIMNSILKNMGYYIIGTIYDDEGICPDGMILPREQDYENLVSYLGGDDIACGKMKVMVLIIWNLPIQEHQMNQVLVL